MYSNGQPLVQQNSQNPNQIDVRLDRNVRHEKVSQSEALRGWALTELNRIDWLEIIQLILATATIGFGTLQLAWLIMPYGPLYHTLIRWSLFAAPIVLVVGWCIWFSVVLNRPNTPMPSGKMIQVAIGVWLVWVVHALGS